MKVRSRLRYAVRAVDPVSNRRLVLELSDFPVRGVSAGEVSAVIPRIENDVRTPARWVVLLALQSSVDSWLDGRGEALLAELVAVRSVRNVDGKGIFDVFGADCAGEDSW